MKIKANISVVVASAVLAIALMGALGAAAASTIWEIEDAGGLAGARIATGVHCFGCTAGAGSSCGGAIA